MLLLPDEIGFWARQLSEHALFFHLGLEEPDLKQSALLLHEQWEFFRSGESGENVLDLCAELRDFKSTLLSRLAQGEWLGWIWFTFVEHTRRELDLFVMHLRAQTFDSSELCDWLRFMAEHAAFAAHLLDPVEAAKVREATAVVGKFSDLCRSCSSVTPQLLSLSHRAGKELDAWLGSSGLGTASTKSIVHPVLAEHVVREGRRFLQTVEALR